VMPRAQWPALLCRHIPDRFEHLVRHVGWYSNRARGSRAKVQQGEDAPARVLALYTAPIESVIEPLIEPISAFASRAVRASR